MFDQCLKILLIFGLFSAVARGEDEYSSTSTSTIADKYNECYAGDPVCDWKNDPSANQNWSLTSFDGATNLYASFDGSSPRGNSSIRTISPIFSRDDNYSCVSMDFRSFSEPNGGFVGLRVYQKPVHVALTDLITLYSDEAKKNYIVYEVWGGQGGIWNFEDFRLKHFDNNFQIILEGVFGELPVRMKISSMELKRTTDCTGHIPYTIPNRQTTSTEQATRENGDTITDRVAKSDTRVDPRPASTQSNPWQTITWPATIQTLQEGNGCDSRNPPIILSLTAPGNSFIDFRVRPPCSAGAASGALTDLKMT